MSDIKCGVLTQEMVESAAARAAEQGYRLPMRIVSPKSFRILKKIHAKFPDWDGWQVEGEIWVKARKLGILDD
jgi:hypothetical protein